MKADGSNFFVECLHLRLYVRHFNRRFSIKPASASPLEGAGGCGPSDGAGGVGKGVGIFGGPAESGPLVGIVWQTVWNLPLGCISM